MAEVGSWKLIEENAKDIIYGFKPKIESKEDKKFLPFVDGRLTIDAQTKTIKQYQLSNSKPFKPAVVAKIHKFLLQLDFLKVDTDMYYLSKVTMNINGRAMLKRFQQSSLVEYSEFERVK